MRVVARLELVVGEVEPTRDLFSIVELSKCFCIWAESGSEKTSSVHFDSKWLLSSSPGEGSLLPSREGANSDGVFFQITGVRMYFGLVCSGTVRSKL